MSTPHGQSWENSDKDIREFVLKVVELLKKQINLNLVGVYLHGSLAMGYFYKPKSDFDFLVVINNAFTQRERQELFDAITGLSSFRPTVGDIECSVVLLEDIKNPKQPMPYQMLYPLAPGGRPKSGLDSDLIASIQVAYNYGIALVGPKFSTLCGEISWNDYTGAIMTEVDWIIENENILENPIYGILTVCRAMKVLEVSKPIVVSKEEGALWALKKFPAQYHPVIAQALQAYRSNEPVSSEQGQNTDENWPITQLLAFRDFIKEEVQKLPKTAKNCQRLIS